MSVGLGPSATQKPEVHLVAANYTRLEEKILLAANLNNLYVQYYRSGRCCQCFVDTSIVNIFVASELAASTHLDPELAK